MRFFRPKPEMVAKENALPGRSTAMPVAASHAVLGTPMTLGSNRHLRELVLGMGCFWGAERRFWKIPGVYSTAVGYAGGYTPNPTYEEVCSGLTGHTEAVWVAYDPQQVSLRELLHVFWEAHDPTQEMGQGNDMGTQYRSALYLHKDDLPLAEQTRQEYQQMLSADGLGAICTEIGPWQPFYYAEDYHQQYLHKNPGGYCGLVSAEQGGRPHFAC